MMINRHDLIRGGKMLLTIALAALAALVLWKLYHYYTYAPQTRDGRLRADVVQMAPDVSGRVESVAVADDQVVKKGDLLFTIDKARLRNALDQANAAIATARATLSSANREARRYAALEGVVSEQDRDLRRSAAEEARARLSQALADRDLARINLERAEVRAPVNGIVTNLQLRPGAYATAGKPLMALIDSDSFYVAGYFEETKLAHIRDGMPATIRLMGEDRKLKGHVVGHSAGIEDRERATSSDNLLADVNPTFSWVRLAQRIPVRVAIDQVPDGVDLIAGRTATITLEGADDHLQPDHVL
ncbi:HlyD family secretion protein [Altericroceibacterium endophyticum]|uniref:Efflux RND transporter periplasmic adaptor subunit n=1 Tax=Altericroceibacterium endophyticum TaxID=1808508 RepID=A0A6I4T242_9SPHN|nr:HlyD family secretion protein [Altericroceibacterium endophyticum]MXO64163.1 efflux RND transporter periplasmic adaptor subunit [Altericroceibacterium endophyticum]